MHYLNGQPAMIMLLDHLPVTKGSTWQIPHFNDFTSLCFTSTFHLVLFKKVIKREYGKTHTKTAKIQLNAKDTKIDSTTPDKSAKFIHKHKFVLL